MNLLLGEGLAVIAFIVAGATSLAVYGRVASSYRIQRRSLEVSSDAMNLHFDTLGKLMAEPVVPVALCEWLLSLHDAVRDPEVCKRLTAILERDTPPGQARAAGTGDLHAEIDWLAGHRPELLAEVMRALASLLYGTQLRHLANEAVSLRRPAAPRKTVPVVTEPPTAMVYKLNRAVDATWGAPHAALAA